MLAREFNYSEEWVDEYMDFDKFNAHQKYLQDNPPAGTMLLVLLEGLAGEKGKKHKNNIKDKVENGKDDVDDFLSFFGENPGAVFKKKTTMEGGEI